MKLIVGLGNPGRKYERTRHNAGFMTVDLLAERLDAEFGREKFRGLYAEGRLPKAWAGPVGGDGRVLLVKPQTFMNLSGETTLGFVQFYKVGLHELLVVVDDVALELGVLRLRTSGSAGGHNGLKDIESRLGSQAFARLRVGGGGREAQAARPVEDLAGHVLSRFSAQEEKVFAQALEKAADASLTWCGQGPEEAMNRFNAK